MTNTVKIFAATAPYNNQYQGNYTRLLFVCTVGMLRSPTAAEIGVEFGYNTRSCGHDDVALIPLTANLIAWADHIIFVSKSDEILALKKFESSGWDEDIEQKKITLHIDDNYNFSDPELRLILRNSLRQLEDAGKLHRTRKSS
jgi:predicted protein tyrosine phosphatase